MNPTPPTFQQVGFRDSVVKEQAGFEAARMFQSASSKAALPMLPYTIVRSLDLGFLYLFR